MVTTSTKYLNRPQSVTAASSLYDQFEICELDSVHGSLNLETLQRLEHFEIFWIKSGIGNLCLDESSISLERETVYCLGPGQIRKFAITAPLHGYYLRMAPAFLHLVHDQFDLAFMLKFSVGKLRPSETGHNETMAGLEEVVGRLLKEFKRSDCEYRIELIKGFLKVFILYLTQEFVTGHDQVLDHNSIILRRFAELLKKHVKVKKMVSEYAEDLCVSPNYLNSIIKKVTGLTASHHIQQHIVQEAKRHAIYSGMRMKEIAFHLGFEDQAHFSKFFKNYSGTNFSTFKKEIASGNAMRV